MNQRKKNILFTSSWFPSKSHRTLGNFVQRHAEAVALSNNVHVLYIAFSPAQQQNFIIEDHIELNVNITIVYCKPAGLFNPLRKWRGFLLGIKHLIKNKQFAFDVVHHNVIWRDGWQPWLIHRKYKIPYIITEHWTGFDKATRGKAPILLRPFARFFSRKASMLCPVTQNLADNMKSFGINGNYRIVPNVVDMELFHITPKPQENVRFLHVSSLINDHKNISGILRAWKKAISENPNMHLTIGGDGPWQFFQQESQQLKIPTESITFFGEKSWAGIAELMQQSHCLILFSNYENLPCVIVESLASGMSIISTRVGGISEHINPERGILIRKKDEEGLIQAILKTTETYKSIDSNKLRGYAQSHFSKQQISKAFDEAYNETLRG